ncbi:glycosyltransferase [Iodidimonas sp. SYSU 1G8]|uniref:tetratricopeptide repeat protein n=1 Tax=Iodidimonas sp. SYSU 1G8 TaxID=3133967 RepID=UPI0031FE4D14
MNSPTAVSPVSAAPLEAEALNLLNGGQHARALPLLRALHAQAPGALTAYRTGVALARSGETDEAAWFYRQALIFDRHMIEARVNLGNILRTDGNLAEARFHHLLAYARAPRHAIVLGNLAETFAASDLREEARFIAAFMDAPPRLVMTQAAPTPAEPAWRRADACHTALVYNPSAAQAWLALGRAYAALARPEDAWDAFAAATDAGPDLAEAWSELEVASRRLGRTQATLEALERLRTLLPDNVQVLNNLGGMLVESRDYHGALRWLSQAAARAPADAMVLTNLMAAHTGLGQHAEALAAGLRLAAVSRPDAALTSKLAVASQHLFDWSALPELRHALDQARQRGDTSAHPFSLVALPGAGPEYQRACAAHFGHGRAQGVPALPRPAPSAAGGPLRIGYVSGEFREHATAWLLAEVLEHHDKARFHVTGFSTAEDETPGPTRRRLARAFSELVDISRQSDEEAAALIRARGIDVLLDLNGYTGTMRPGIFARRPASVQVNYLGFPGTLGTDFMDYIIADAVVIPPSLERFYAETVLRLPHCYQPNDRNRPLPPPARRADVGLPEDAFVFCSFNNAYKLTPDVFDQWCALLADVPGSVLWVLSGNTAANDNLHREAAARGIDPARLVFAGRMDLAGHLARFRCADLFLDTFPCTAHTTASDALWCGVPVVTRLGETFASRVAASILHAAGLPQLVAESADDYLALARRLATAPAELAAIRQHLEQVRMTCPLFDSKTYTRDLEALYRRVAGR